MPRNTQDIELHKGDATTDEENLRDTLPDARVTRPESAQEDELDEAEIEEIDLDQLPEFEGPDA